MNKNELHALATTKFMTLVGRVARRDNISVDEARTRGYRWLALELGLDHPREARLNRLNKGYLEAVIIACTPQPDPNGRPLFTAALR